ncbi:MAG: SWIM zinc finger family protein [Spirochaetes bacterium]|nr:SWIM zinc finger family protein [Spirochaetota bacterium]
MEEVTFLVQGSAADPYTVTFKQRSPGNLSAYCTCPAGEKGTFCKHRLGILRGEARGIVSPNAADVARVRSWLAGSDVEAAIAAVEACEDAVTRAESDLAKAKKALGRAMLD